MYNKTDENIHIQYKQRFLPGFTGNIGILF